MKSPAPKQKPARKAAALPGPKAGRSGGGWLGRHWPGCLIALAVAVAAAWGGWRYFRGPGTGAGGIRNVVLISIDTCRADRLSCYGYKRPSTPNVDAVAREGVLFQTALTPVPMTTPAHSSMLTGTYPPTHGVRLNNGDRLGESSVTLAEVLQKAGYRTAAFVGGFPLDAQFGLNQGFDTYDCQFSRTNDRSKTIAERPAEEVNAPALAWLEQNAAKPFFLFLHYYDAHLPYDPPRPYATDFADDLYAGEIAHVDHCIGQVLDRLRAMGQYDDTLVIVTGDHGEGLGEHGERAHAVLVYQSTLHVPLVVHVPQGRRGLRVGGNVDLVDIVPTVLDLVGLKAPAQVQGVSLRGALETGAAPARKQPLYCESLEASTFGCSPLNGVLEGGWKYIRAPRQELYDLKGDPDERNNVIDKEPPVARRLRGQLETMLPQMESGAAQRGHSTVDAEALKKLQGLGYMGAGAAPATSAFDPTLDDPKDLMPTYERFQKATSLFNLNRSPEAKKELLEIVAARPQLIAAQALLAQIAAQDKQWADGADRCAAIVSLLVEWKKSGRPVGPDAGDPTGGRLDTRDLATARCNLAVMLKALGKLPEAIGQYEQALALAPDSAEVHFNLGAALAQAGRQDEAFQQYQQAVRIKPDHAEARLNLGAALQEAGKEAEAVDQYERALRSKPDYVEAHYNLAMALQRMGRLPEAIGHYEQVLRLRPEYAKTDRHLVSALAAARKVNEAIERCRQILKANPEDAQAHNNLGGLLRQTGRAPEAVGHLEQALRIRPDYVEARYNLALATAQLDKWPEAIEHYAQTLRLKPDFVPALNNLAWLRATQQDPKLRDGAEAVRLAEHACQIAGRKEFGLLDTLAAAYAEAGRFPDAVATAQEALAAAQAANQPAAVNDIQLRLSAYKAGQAFRDSPPLSPATRP